MAETLRHQAEQAILDLQRLCQGMNGEITRREKNGWNRYTELENFRDRAAKVAQELKGALDEDLVREDEKTAPGPDTELLDMTQAGAACPECGGLLIFRDLARCQQCKKEWRY